MRVPLPGTTPTQRPAPSARAEVAELYDGLSARLEQIVRLAVDASDPVVEDACQFAWDQLIRHRTRVRRDTALWWLARTAVREASKLVRLQQRYLSLDSLVEADVEPGSAGPEELVLQRERLDSIARLPERQRQMVWLRALGLSYAEIAVQTDCTVRTVERQLMRAKRAMRVADGPAVVVSRGPGARRAAVRTRRSAPAA
jgi:RNA polymerase sigma factor (sigma-70 family)